MNRRRLKTIVIPFGMLLAFDTLALRIHRWDQYLAVVGGYAAGVVVFHGLEALGRRKKAKIEAKLTHVSVNGGVWRVDYSRHELVAQANPGYRLAIQPGETALQAIARHGFPTPNPIFRPLKGPENG